MEPGPAEA